MKADESNFGHRGRQNDARGNEWEEKATKTNNYKDIKGSVLRLDTREEVKSRNATTDVTNSGHDSMAQCDKVYCIKGHEWIYHECIECM